MCRIMVAILPSLLFLCPRFSQSPRIAEQETVRTKQLFQSVRWVDKAWGAYLAGHLHSQVFREPLIEALRLAEPLHNVPMDGEEYAYVQSLFEALIELGGIVPFEVLKPFENRWRPEVLILMARDSGNEDTLFAMRDEQLSDGEWLTVNNLLFKIGSGRFFAKTLAEVDITHDFVVKDVDTPGYGRGGDRAWSSPMRHFPKGFPPIALYRLVAWPAEGDLLLVHGPHNVYYRRIIVPVDGSVSWDPTGWDDKMIQEFGFCYRQEFRLEYLAQLGPMSVDDVRRLFETGTTIHWLNAQEFMLEVETQLSAQETAIRSFVANARQHGMGDVSGMPLKIVSRFLDLRQNAHDALPAVAAREFVLD